MEVKFTEAGTPGDITSRLQLPGFKTRVKKNKMVDGTAQEATIN